MTHGDSWMNPSVAVAVATYLLLGLATGSWLSRTHRLFSPLRSLDRWISGWRWPTVLALVTVAFLAFVPLHLETLRSDDDHAAHHELLIDHWRFFGPQASDVLRGDNPYANYTHGDNHGILRLWISVVAVAVGGYAGSALAWTGLCFAVPIASRWLALRAGLSARVANYAALLTLVTPAAVEMNAVMAQEDGLVAVAVIVPIGLLLAGRPGWAAVAAGVLAHVKLPSLFFTAPAFALYVAHARTAGGPLLPPFLRSVQYGVASVAAFLPLFVVGAWLYGGAYVRSILGVADPVNAPHQFAMQSFTLADLLRTAPEARTFLVLASALVLLGLLLFLYLGATRFDPVAASLLLLIGFYLTGYYLKEHYLSWAMPLLILWALRRPPAARVLVPGAASVLLHGWAIAAGGLVAEEPIRTLAAAAQTLLLGWVAWSLVVELRGNAVPGPPQAENTGV